MAGESMRKNQQLDALNQALASGTLERVRRPLNNLPAPEVAHLLESSPPRQRELLWQLLTHENESEVLQYLNEEVRAAVLKGLSGEELVPLIEDFDTDDLADLVQQLPEKVTEQVLASLDHQNRTRLESVLRYPENTAGGLMDLDAVSVRPEITMETVQRYLRLHGDLPPMTDRLAVVNRANEFVGTLPLSRVLVSDVSTTVREAMMTDEDPILATQSARAVAQLFERRDLVSAPVVNTEGQLLGRITIDDVVDVIRDESERSMMGISGLGEDEDTFGPISTTVRQRAVWLGIKLVTALAAAAVISLFQDTIRQVVALAVLMPIVASMGGIAGNQSLTLVVRAMALGQIHDKNMRYLLGKELAVGGFNGLIWAVMVGLASGLWFDDPLIGVILAAAMLINLVIAAATGALLPITLRRVGIDPALAGAVVITTITDIVGFLATLGLATLVLAQLA